MSRFSMSLWYNGDLEINNLVTALFQRIPLPQMLRRRSLGGFNSKHIPWFKVLFVATLNDYMMERRKWTVGGWVGSRNSHGQQKRSTVTTSPRSRRTKSHDLIVTKGPCFPKTVQPESVHWSPGNIALCEGTFSCLTFLFHFSFDFHFS